MYEVKKLVIGDGNHIVNYKLVFVVLILSFYCVNLTYLKVQAFGINIQNCVITELLITDQNMPCINGL